MLQKRRGGRASRTRFATDLHSIHHVPLLMHTVNITRAHTLEEITAEGSCLARAGVVFDFCTQNFQLQLADDAVSLAAKRHVGWQLRRFR